MNHAARMARARLALEGLSVGDAFGQRFFTSEDKIEAWLGRRELPPGAPWMWTDDTAMALSIYEVLDARHGIDCDALAHTFAARYARDPARGYGGTAHGILHAIGAGVPWQTAAGSVFDGAGSMGNGGAMRVAPIGAYFADDLDAVVEHARRSAAPTHAHPDGVAGAIAVAIAAALPASDTWLEEILSRTPPGATHDGIEKACKLPLSYDLRTAVAALGNGELVISSDTVPLSLWCAARHLDNFEEALWTTVAARGDRDTTCAIVGGIVALKTGNVSWAEQREPLPIVE